MAADGRKPHAHLCPPSIAMFPPVTQINPLIQSPVFFENTVIPDELSLLCWNVHKENLRPNFSAQVKNWKRSHGLDIILLQEARFSKALFSIAGFPYVAAANIRISGQYAGVVTAANADPHSSGFQMTLAREPLVFTPKNTLVTRYGFNDKTSLMVVNIHAINFRSLSWYQWEFSRLFELLKGYSGPMVLAGDFNCWRRSRKKILDQFTQRLGLEYAIPKNGGHVKKWFGFHLDRVYFRGLILKEIQALYCKRLSDHNPIIAGFERPV